MLTILMVPGFLIISMGGWILYSHNCSGNAKTKTGNIVGMLTIVLGLLAIIGAIFLYPQVAVKLREAEGLAQLAEATSNRRIKVEEAQATLDAASKLAAAEIARANGVAEANRIVADGLGGPEGYLRYLYIDGLSKAEGNGTTIIYVPTEAGLPILESTRLK